MEEEIFYPATNDVIFKSLFIRKPNLLKGFLSAVLEIPRNEIVNLTIRNTELLPDVYDGKFPRLDILLETKERLINIEMQNAKTEDYKERVLFYWAEMYPRELDKGKSYNAAPAGVCINIMNFNMFSCEEYHSVFSVFERNRHELLTDKMQLHFLELKKVSKKPDEKNFLQLWMQVFKAKKKEEFEMLKTVNSTEIQESVDVIYALNADKQVRELARQREKAERDYLADMASAEEKGKKQRDLELASLWRANGMSEEQIKKLLSGNF